MSLGHYLRELMFGRDEKANEDGARKEWRSAMHENRNATAVSSGAARLSKKASDEALKVQKKAVTLLECVRDKARRE